MTLPSSGNISLQQIQDEFAAPRGTGITSFYRGGSYVANTGANAGVPTSGNIGLTSFYGAQRVGPLFVGAPNASGNSYPGSNAVFASSQANASGGSPPYSYAWTYVSGSSFTIDSPSSQFTNFRRAGNPPQGSSASGTYRVTVTDSASTQVNTTITVSDTRA